MGVFVQQLDIFTCVNNLKLWKLLCHIRQKILYAAAIYNKNIRRGKLFHILGRQLVIMHTARLWLA